MKRRALSIPLALAIIVCVAVPRVSLADGPGPSTVVPLNGPSASVYGPIAYDPSGNIAAIGSSSGVTSYYIYDPMGRVREGHVQRSGNLQSQTYTYDLYGNRLTVGGSAGSNSYSVDATTNRFGSTGFPYAQYDAAGNMTRWMPPGSASSRQYSYDALNMITKEEVPSGAWVVHVYTAGDERLWSYASSIVSHYTIRDLAGKVLRDYEEDADGFSLHRDYIYRDGLLLSAVTPTGTHHYSLDHLGTPRLVTDQNGQKIAEHTYYPFGVEITDSSPTDGPLKFTGHERDADLLNQPTGALDYMHVRYYAANLGRFLSVDPVSGIPSKPQSWNKYSYVQNQPVNFHDPTGAYRTDFHYALTRIIAVAAGYSVADATTIAAMTELPDHDGRNPENAANYSARTAYHFPSRARLHAMYVDASASNGFFEIGTYLHGLQDSFSHSGHGPLIGHIGPLLWGGVIDGVNSLIGGPTGALAAGYAESYDVDTTSSRPGLAMDAARATYDALVKFNGGHAKASFSAISSAIQGYLSADEHSVLRTFYENRLKKQLGIP